MLAWLLFGQYELYELSNEKKDLDNITLHFTESILHPLHSWSQHGGSIILQGLYYLACAFATRAAVYEQLEDAIYATKYLFHLRNQPHPIPDIPRYKVTAFLVRSLLSQVKLKAGNVMQNIREIAVLSRELFDLNTSESDDVDTRGLILLLYGVVISDIDIGVPDQPLDELIECLRAARKHRPDLLEGRFALAISLITRYGMTYVNDDYEEAASILDEIIADTSLGDPQDKFLAIAQGRATGLVTTLAMMRSESYRTPEYLEETIYRTRTFINSSSVKEYFPEMVFDLEATSKKRLEYFGSIEGVDASSGKYHSLEEPAFLEFNQTFHKMQNLLFGIRNNDDTTEIDKAIEKGRLLLASSSLHSDHYELILDIFGSVLFAAFKRTNKIEYLDESISVHRQLIETPLPQNVHFKIFRSLSCSLLSRFRPSQSTTLKISMKRSNYSSAMSAAQL